MVIAGWRKNFEILAVAGERPCGNCQHVTRHFLLGERKEIRLYFVPVARFGRKHHIVCDVCGHMTALSEDEASAVMRDAIDRGTTGTVH